jgi:hypothetical protein
VNHIIPMIVFTALFFYTNSWADDITGTDSLLKILEEEKKKAEVLNNAGAKQRSEWYDKALKELNEKAPERCVCSGLGVFKKRGVVRKATVLNCKCGEAQCVVNLEGGISCLKQGLFK